VGFTTYLCPQIYVFLVNLWVTTYLKKRETASVLVPSFQEIGHGFIKINKYASSLWKGNTNLKFFGCLVK
jgi:hypothetical protein